MTIRGQSGLIRRFSPFPRFPGDLEGCWGLSWSGWVGRFHPPPPIRTACPDPPWVFPPTGAWFTIRSVSTPLPLSTGAVRRVHHAPGARVLCPHPGRLAHARGGGWGGKRLASSSLTLYPPPPRVGDKNPGWWKMWDQTVGVGSPFLSLCESPTGVSLP